MGRILNGREAHFFNSINVEVMKLFCNEDWYLYRFSEEDSQPYEDPLWNEYDALPKFRRYKIYGFREKPTFTYETTEQGQRVVEEAVITLSRKILEKAGVPYDKSGDLVSTSDFIQVNSRGDVKCYDIVHPARDGYVMNSDYWTQYICETAQRLEYLPQRKK